MNNLIKIFFYGLLFCFVVSLYNEGEQFKQLCCLNCKGGLYIKSNLSQDILVINNLSVNIFSDIAQQKSFFDKKINLLVIINHEQIKNRSLQLLKDYYSFNKLITIN